MKLIGIMMVFLGCTLVGVMLDNGSKLRIKELRAFIRGFESIKGEIEYHLTPLSEACLHISESMGEGINEVFHSFGKALEQRRSLDTEQLWQDALKEYETSYHLKKEDYELLEPFGRRIGELDKVMQQKDITYIIERLTSKVVQLEAHAEKTSKMTIQLSMLLGACLSLLLI